MPARFIAIAGNIGAGKSTMVRFLSRRFALQPLYEPVEANPYLDDFYADMKRWAFESQIFYLSRKFALHAAAQRSEQRIVLDRTIYEDADIFVESLRARHMLTGRDYNTYRELYETIRFELQPPDLVVYLRCSVKGVRHRIRKRGRVSEESIPLAYMQQLHRRYEQWFEGYALGPKAVIETDRLDYLSDIIDRVDLFEQIQDLLR
ncbi:MAG: deoxynucleoside kinase [Myxococcota bacterium]|nr:deoxynucleoside kinase [Myxococcota bacterium]